MCAMQSACSMDVPPSRSTAPHGTFHRVPSMMALTHWLRTSSLQPYGMTSNRTPSEATRRHIRHHIALRFQIPANVIIPTNNPIHAPEAVPLPDPPKNEKRGGTSMYAAIHSILLPISIPMGNGKRRNTTYTERPTWHDDDTEPHSSIARECPTCLRDGTDGTCKASKNERGSAPFHVKHPIKLPVSLPALRLVRRHASPSVQENGTGSGATALDTRSGTIRNALHTPIPTAETSDTRRKTSIRREGNPQERHRRRPKGDAGTPADGENGGETTRFAARGASRKAKR